MRHATRRGPWHQVLTLGAGQITTSPPSVLPDFSLVENANRRAEISASRLPVRKTVPQESNHPNSQKPVLLISHDFAAAGAQLLLVRLVRWLRANTDIPFEILINVPRSAAGNPSPAEKLVLDGFKESAEVHFISDLTHAPENLPLIRANCYSLIFGNTLTLGVLLAAMRPFAAPVISHVHELGFWIERRTGPAAVARQLANTDEFIAVSASVRDYLINRLDVSSSPMQVIDDFASLERAHETRARYTRETARRELGLPADAFIVVACGTYDWRKGAELLVPICVALRRKLAGKPFRVVWVGAYGPQLIKDQFNHEVATTGLTGVVELAGPQNDPLRWMRAADCFALSSREDPFPIVMLEGASLGLPVVGFQSSGGVEEFAANGAGLVVPYLDLEAFASALADLALQPGLAARLGTEAESRVRNQYNQGVSFRRIADLILSVQRAWPNRPVDA